MVVTVYTLYVDYVHFGSGLKDLLKAKKHKMSLTDH